jgi:hypothetical protein
MSEEKQQKEKSYGRPVKTAVLTGKLQIVAFGLTGFRTIGPEQIRSLKLKLFWGADGLTVVKDGKEGCIPSHLVDFVEFT